MGQGLWLLRKIKEEKRLRREEQRKDLLQQTREKLGDYFRKKGIMEVYLFGSIIRENSFYEWSDVDIAASLGEIDYFHMLSEIERLLGRDVHIIPLRECPFVEQIQKEGVRIL